MSVINVILSEASQKESILDKVWDLFATVYPPRVRPQLSDMKPWKSEGVFQCFDSDPETVFREHVMNPDVDLWLVLEEKDYTPLAMGTVCYNEEQKYDCHYHLSCVATDPSHRRRGYAKELIETIVGYYSEGIRLEVNRVNPAIRLYEQCGFQKTAEAYHFQNLDFEEEYSDPTDIIMTYRV